MYFWKTKLLVDELQNNSIGEKSLKNYYVATSILVTVGYYLAFLDPRENVLALAVEAVATIVVTIIGLNAALNANGGPSGVGFLNKIVSISFPLLIKVLGAGFALGIVLVVMESSGANQTDVEWVQSIASIAIQIVMFWRLVVHIKRTNA